LPTKQPANKLLAHELESCAVIESSKPEKSVVLERILANLSNRVKQGRLGRNDHKEASPTTDSPMNTIKSKQLGGHCGLPTGAPSRGLSSH
jgi:hypothetical protein